MLKTIEILANIFAEFVTMEHDQRIFVIHKAAERGPCDTVR